MNDNARALYEDLKANKLPAFNMKEWCGSARCIGGEAFKRAGEPRDSMDVAAAKFLGLDMDTAKALFYPEDVRWPNAKIKKHPKNSPWSFMGDRDAYKATQQQAAEALKRACELSEGNSHETQGRAS